MNCRHTNGAITGYSVRYGERGSEREGTLLVSSEETEAVVSGLNSGQLYTVRVAAVNSAGEGSYSQPVEGKYHFYFYAKVF